MTEKTEKDKGLMELMAKEIINHLDVSQLTQKSEAELKKMVRTIVKKHKKEIVVKNLDTSIAKEVGLQHKQFEVLLKSISAMTHVFMVGPAGSGKTMAASEASKALKKEFGCMSVGPQTTQSHIMGYMDANGNYVSTEFRRRYENGGVFLFDEIDAANPAVLTCINSAIANEVCSFPDQMVSKHDEFIVVASGNTFGRGANRQYVGRNQLDAATLDRFVVIDWDYDEELEKSICENQEWVETVQAVRQAIEELGIRHVVSPRASIFGERLLEAGLTEDQVEEMVLFKGLDEDSYAKIQAKVEEISKKKRQIQADKRKAA